MIDLAMGSGSSLMPWADDRATVEESYSSVARERPAEADRAAVSIECEIARREDGERQMGIELLVRVGAGDEGALATFYQQFAPVLYGMALKMMRDEKESEDVLQEAFICIWRKAANFNAQLGSAFSWAAMILRNKAIDRLRTRNRVEKLMERAIEETSTDTDCDARSAEEPIFREQRTIVRSALGQLPEEQRQAVDLAFFSGLTHEEIAVRLDTPLGTIKARIRRGLLAMRTLVMEAR